MAERQAKLYTTQTYGGTKQITTTINNINPEATSTTLTTFTKMLNRLTSNTYGKTDLVETYNADTEEIPQPAQQKQSATLTLTPNTFTKTQVMQGSAMATVTTTSDYTGTPLVSTSKTDSAYYYDDPVRLLISGDGEPQVFTVMIPETENYYAASATITITN